MRTVQQTKYFESQQKLRPRFGPLNRFKPPPCKFISSHEPDGSKGELIVYHAPAAVRCSSLSSVHQFQRSSSSPFYEEPP